MQTTSLRAPWSARGLATALVHVVCLPLCRGLQAAPSGSVPAAHGQRRPPGRFKLLSELQHCIVLHVCARRWSGLRREVMAAAGSEMREVSRERLAWHDTRATYEGVVEGSESTLMIYPPMANKLYESFRVNAYLEYDKPGEYGDSKTDKFTFVASEQPSAAVRAAAEALAPGDCVRLAWSHDYVTRAGVRQDGGEFTSKSPERVVHSLERLAE